MRTDRLGSVSLDVDNLWSYLKIHGNPLWRTRPTYLAQFVPLVLESLDRLGLKLTFFIVGADAADERNHAALRRLTESGHEVGNHSFEHEPWLERYPAQSLRSELVSADAAIRNATGRAPVGFRGPGFSFSSQALEVAGELGYAFDASTFPTWLGPLARAYYFATATLSEEQRRERRGLFGGLADGRRPLRPYYWKLPGGGRLLEIPVTTMPLLRTPFHLSYLLYLARLSEGLAMAYLRAALSMCRAARIEPSFLLHPLDVMGADLVPDLAFFPGMDLPTSRKVRLFERALRVLGAQFALVPMGRHAAAIRTRSDVPQLAVA